VALACGVGAPAHAGSTATRPASGQPVDQERRNREYQHAEALYLSGRYKEAAEDFERLSRAYPRDARIWLKYGNTLTKQGSYDNAAVAFQTALSLDPDLGGAALNLALVHLAEAQDALDAAVNRLAAGTPERAQAEGLQQQLNTLMGAPGRNASAH
jgi:TolA-binding protein